MLSAPHPFLGAICTQIPASLDLSLLCTQGAGWKGHPKVTPQCPQQQAHSRLLQRRRLFRQQRFTWPVAAAVQ